MSRRPSQKVQSPELPIPQAADKARRLGLLREAGFARGRHLIGRIALLVHEARELGGGGGGLVEVSISVVAMESWVSDRNRIASVRWQSLVPISWLVEK